MAKQVRGKLRANHVTQRELADSVGMSEQALSNKLRGLKNFTLRDVSRIADFFDVSTDFVLGRGCARGFFTRGTSRLGSSFRLPLLRSQRKNDAIVFRYALRVSGFHRCSANTFTMRSVA
ncbi:helix-turn-helix domain-containing protein, partial [Escherichia coli]|nr:helix-turn-helix domain-containing protein [Escherichia coli]